MSESTGDRGSTSASPVTADDLTRRFVFLRALRWLPIGVLLPVMIATPQARGLSLQEVGLALAVHSAISIVLEVPSGALADAVGRRRVVVAGAILTATSLMVFALAEDIRGFSLALGTLAAGRALVSGSLEAWYVDAVRKLQPDAALTTALSRGATAEALAMGAGALAGGCLAAFTGRHGGLLPVYGWVAVVAAAAALAFAAAAGLLISEPPGATVTVDSRPLGRRTLDILSVAHTEAAASLTVRLILVMAIAFGLCTGTVELLWQPRVTALFGGKQVEGLALGAMAAASMATIAAGARLSPTASARLGASRAYIAAISFTAVGIALAGLAAGAVDFAIAYLLLYGALGVVEPVHYQLLNDAVGPTARATILSAESVAMQSGALFASIGAGALATSHGTRTAWLVAAGVLAVAAAAVAGPLRKDVHRANLELGGAR
jgi:MFS family permease